MKNLIPTATLCFLSIFSRGEAGDSGLYPKFEAIHSSKKQEMCQSIKEFPIENYRICHVPQPGAYLIDSIDDHVKNILRSGRDWEPHIREHINLYAKTGTTVIDVGAHIGVYTLEMSRAVGVLGKVVAIEPQPKLFRELVMNMALNQADNIEFYWAAAGSANGKIGLAPLIAGNEAATSLEAGGPGGPVDLITIDSLKLSNVSLIKIDVAHMEDAVFEGAKETILRNKPMIILDILGGTPFEYATPAVQEQIFNTIKKIEDMGYFVGRMKFCDYLATPIGK